MRPILLSYCLFSVACFCCWENIETVRKVGASEKTNFHPARPRPAPKLGIALRAALP